MHLFSNDTHPLCLGLGPMGDISFHESVVACDTILDSNHRSARYVPRNIINIVARDRPLKWYILLSHNTYQRHVLYAMQMTCSDKSWGNNHLVKKTIHNINKYAIRLQIIPKHHKKRNTRIYTLNKDLEIHLP